MSQGTEEGGSKEDHPASLAEVTLETVTSISNYPVHTFSHRLELRSHRERVSAWSEEIGNV